MRCGKIGNMNVVADTGAIIGRVIGAENFDLATTSQRDVENRRHQVGLGIMILADFSVGVGAGGIEISQGDEAKIVCDGEIAQHPLDDELGEAIGVDRGGGFVFADWDAGGNAVDRTRARKDKTVRPVFEKRRKQRRTAGDIIAVVFSRIGDGLADIGISGKMQNGDRPVGFEDQAKAGAVRDVSAFERAPFRPPIRGRAGGRRRRPGRSRCGRVVYRCDYRYSRRRRSRGHVGSRKISALCDQVHQPRSFEEPYLMHGQQQTGLPLDRADSSGRGSDAGSATAGRAMSAGIRPRVMHVAQSDREGGANRATYRLHRALCEAGVDSLLWTAHKSTNDSTVVAAQRTRAAKLVSQLVAFANSRVPYVYPGGRSALFSTVQLTYGRFDQTFLEDVDIVCLHWIAGAFLKPSQLLRLGRPIVWQLWDAWPFTGGCHYPAECRKFEGACGTCPMLGSRNAIDLARLDFNARRRAYGDLDLTIVSPSKWLAEQARRSALFRNRRIELIPSGVDLSIFHPHDKQMARDILGLPKEQKIILFGANAATTDRRKGYHLIPATMSRVVASSVGNDVTLVVFGGPQRLKRDVDEIFGLPTIHIGRLEDDVSLSLLYAAADVLVAPYLEDNLPFVILEALACGTPVVAFAAGGIPDAIDHEINGALAAIGNTDELARGIEWVLAEPARHARACRAARATAESRFDLRDCARHFHELFAELACRSRTQRALS